MPAGECCFGAGAVDFGCVLTGEIGNFFGDVTGACLDPLAFTSVSKLDRLVWLIEAEDLGAETAGVLSVFFGNSADLAMGGLSCSSDRRFFLSIFR